MRSGNGNLGTMTKGENMNIKFIVTITFGYRRFAITVRARSEVEAMAKAEELETGSKAIQVRRYVS